MNLLNIIKSKSMAIMAGLVGILAIAVSFLRARNSALKQEAAEQELEDSKAVYEQANAAKEALLRGTNDENQPIIRNGRIIK